MAIHQCDVATQLPFSLFYNHIGRDLGKTGSPNGVKCVKIERIRSENENKFLTFELKEVSLKAKNQKSV